MLLFCALGLRELLTGSPGVVIRVKLDEVVEENLLFGLATFFSSDIQDPTNPFSPLPCGNLFIRESCLHDAELIEHSVETQARVTPSDPQWLFASNASGQ